MNKKIFWIWLAVTLALLVLFFRIVPRKKTEPAQQVTAPVTAKTPTTVTEPEPWIPDKIIFLNRLVFLEGEKKQRLKRELVEELKRHQQGPVLKKEFWLNYIRKEIKKANLPEDVVYLPVIESGMEGAAVSEKGAAGYWQFMPVTAQKYKLRITPVDERFDPVKSTDAAIKHLKDLFDCFENCTDALGGYNMDPAALKEAMKEERTKNFYELRSIPVETQRFLFRLMATKLIFENSENFNLPKVEWANYESSKILEVDLIIGRNTSEQTVLKEVMAEFPEFSLSEFKKNNPHLRNLNLERGQYSFYIIKNGTS